MDAQFQEGGQFQVNVMLENQIVGGVNKGYITFKYDNNNFKLVHVPSIAIPIKKKVQGPNLTFLLDNSFRNTPSMNNF